MLPHGHPDHAGSALMVLARSAIESALGAGPERTPKCDAPECIRFLTSPGATFVTLTQDGVLRGCIGSLQAHEPLMTDVRANAVRAALHDPRFPPLKRKELGHTEIEISLLSEPEHFEVASRADAQARLRPGVDGVILEYRHHRATFLPQVWDQLPDPAQFLDHLLGKAGLPVGFWDPDVRLSRYAVTAFHEPDVTCPADQRP